MLNRRELLRATTLGSVLIGAGIALQACQSGSSTATNIAQAATYINTFATVLTNFKVELAAIPGAAPLVNAAATYAPILASLATSLTQANGASVISTVEADIQSIVNTAATPPVSGVLPTDVTQAVSDLQVALPVIEALIVGLTAASPNASAAMQRLQGYAAGKH